MIELYHVLEHVSRVLALSRAVGVFGGARPSYSSRQLRRRLGEGPRQPEPFLSKLLRDLAASGGGCMVRRATLVRRSCRTGGGGYRAGAPRANENASSQDPTVGLCIGPCGGTRGCA